jgi:hypothetical protein
MVLWFSLGLFFMLFLACGVSCTCVLWVSFELCTLGLF